MLEDNIVKKLVIDYDECIGCGTCAELYPEVFEMNDDESKASVIAGDKCSICDCEEAAGVCPVEAITIEEG